MTEVLKAAGGAESLGFATGSGAVHETQPARRISRVGKGAIFKGDCS